MNRFNESNCAILNSFRLEDRLAPTISIVNDLTDAIPVPNDGILTLREAILDANRQPSSPANPDIIQFDTSLFRNIDGVPEAKTLKINSASGVGGELPVTENLNIVGPGSGLLTIDAEGQSRIFRADGNDLNLNLSKMTLTGGATTGAGASGGGILYESSNSGSLTLLDINLTNSSTSGSTDAPGGGLFSKGGIVTLKDIRVTQLLDLGGCRGAAPGSDGQPRG